MKEMQWIDLILDVYGKLIMTAALVVSILSLKKDKKKTAPRKPAKQKRKR